MRKKLHFVSHSLDFAIDSVSKKILRDYISK